MVKDRDKVARNALKFIQKGQFQKAIEEYRKVLSADPRDIRTRLKLIDLYGRSGRTAEAIDECLQVAETYADQGFYLKAIAVYKQAVRIDPDNPLLYRNMGEMYVRQGLVGDALGTFKRGVDVLRRQGQGEEAEQLLERMEEMAPENAAIKVHLAELYLEDGKYGAFEEELEKLVLQLRGEGRSRKLLQAMESFYERSAHHMSVLRKLAELYVDLGEEQKALEVVREGLATDPGDRDLRLLALRCHLVTGELPEARRIALRLHEEDPDDLFILEQLVAIAQARGDREESVRTHKAMAKVYGRKGLHQKEDLHYRKVLEFSPEDAEARIALGEVTGGGPSEPEPEEEVPLQTPWGGEAPEAASQDHAVRDGLMEAELYLKYGIEEKAAEKLRELTELAPDDLEIRQKYRDLCQRQGDREGWVREQLRIAELFLRQNRENEALRAYQAILEVAPDCEEAGKALQILKPEAAPGGGAPTRIDLDGVTLEFVDGEGGETVVHRAPPVDEEDELREALAQADFCEAQGRPEDAIGRLLEVRERHPDSPHLAARLERLGWAEGGGEGGQEEFVDLQAEVLDGTELSFGSGFEGFQDFEVSELDDIVREFKSGIAERLDESDYDTHYNLGMAYREMGLLEDAVQEFRLAARSTDKAREACTSLASALRELGRKDEALAALSTALAVPGNTPEDRAAIQYEMGELAEADGDWEGALRSFEKVAEIDPSHRDVGGRLRKLRAVVRE